ncbi:transposase [Candidatus Poriferisocius sp.]|uniref:transposase n=1 Tax=Candidatus Poriferisocius sp. TaxID=3101276 RepID=UPI003B01802E
MEFRGDLGIGQKAIWFQLLRLREATTAFVGALEITNRADKRTKAAGEHVGNAIVASVKDRTANGVVVRVVPDTTADTLVGMVLDNADPSAQTLTDEDNGYLPLQDTDYGHQAIRHTIGQYVNEIAHTNVLGLFWSMHQRGYHGMYHQNPHKHLNRFVAEFSHLHNELPLDAVDQMSGMMKCMDSGQLTHRRLIADRQHATRREQEMAA